MVTKAERYLYVNRRKAIFELIRDLCREMTKDPMERMVCVQWGIEGCYHLIDSRFFDEARLRKCIEMVLQEWRSIAPK